MRDGTFIQMILPIALLAGAAVVFSHLLLPRFTRSHARVVLGILASAVVLLVLAPVSYVVFDARPIYAAHSFAEAMAMGRIVFVQSLNAALVWLPILCFRWLGAAQRVERLRGEDLARGDTP